MKLKKYRITFLADFLDKENGLRVKSGEQWMIQEESLREAEKAVYRRLPDLWTPMGPKIGWQIGQL